MLQHAVQPAPEHLLRWQLQLWQQQQLLQQQQLALTALAQQLAVPPPPPPELQKMASEASALLCVAKEVAVGIARSTVVCAAGAAAASHAASLAQASAATAKVAAVGAREAEAGARDAAAAALDSAVLSMAAAQVSVTMRDTLIACVSAITDQDTQREVFECAASSPADVKHGAQSGSLVHSNVAVCGAHVHAEG